MSTYPQTTVLKKLVIDTLDNAKALDITTLEVTALTTITDIMIICTGCSSRHVRAIIDKVRLATKKAGYRPLSCESEQCDQWQLIDLGDIILHVMQAQTRSFYQLESLWQDNSKK